jgi:hypothetical protein
MPETAPEPAAPSIRHYFVDESGDPTLFNRAGRVIVGEDGCSAHFALGMLDVADTAALDRDLLALRAELMANPFFRSVPSMQPGGGKTALAFHAKDDLPEVRWEVFKVLARHDVKFFAVIRDKHGLAKDVQNKNKASKEYRYRPNDLYDQMVKRLFKDRLHKDDAYRVCFAARGSSDRTQALRHALETARANFRRQWGIESDAPIEVTSTRSTESVGLQAVDYFLWALQRVYTKQEDRFLAFVSERVSLIHDVDDRRKSPVGVYYTREKPLTSERVKKTPGI